MLTSRRLVKGTTGTVIVLFIGVALSTRGDNGREASRHSLGEVRPVLTSQTARRALIEMVMADEARSVRASVTELQLAPSRTDNDHRLFIGPWLCDLGNMAFEGYLSDDLGTIRVSGSFELSDREWRARISSRRIIPLRISG
jgi:hypothetical protein